MAEGGDQAPSGKASPSERAAAAPGALLRFGSVQVGDLACAGFPATDGRATTTPTTAPATKGAAMKVCVMPRWCLSSSTGPAKDHRDVDVGSFGGQHGGQRGVGRFAIQTRAADAGSG